MGVCVCEWPTLKCNWAKITVRNPIPVASTNNLCNSSLNCAPVCVCEYVCVFVSVSVCVCVGQQNRAMGSQHYAIDHSITVRSHTSTQRVLSGGRRAYTHTRM